MSGAAASLTTLLSTAIREGRAAVAVSGSLLRDAEVALALRDRAALAPISLAGKASAPMVEPSAAALARAGVKGGVLILVEPDAADGVGLQKLAEAAVKLTVKPVVVVVGRSPDKFTLMRLFGRVEHLAERGKGWLVGAPVPAAAPTAKAAPASSTTETSPKKPADGPRFVFAGREELVGQVATALREAGGPVVLAGPSGIGRTAVADHAIAASGLRPLAGMTLGRGVGFDTLIGRLAALLEEAGDASLREHLAGPHTPVSAVSAAITALQGAEALAGSVLVVRGLQVATGKEADFFRKSRLELLCEALLTTTFPLRLVFVSAVQPRFFREGRDAGLRRFDLAGLSPEASLEVFEALGVDADSDKLRALATRLHGHPVALRLAAAAVRHDPTLLDAEKFFRMSGPSDTDAVRRQAEKRLEKLPANLRVLVARVAHLRDPAEAGLLAELEVAKKDRATLIAEGVLGMGGTEATKHYAVHPLVRAALDAREASDFDTAVEIARRLRTRQAAATGAAAVALGQDVNRLLVEARNLRDLVALPVPDHDAIVESCMGLLRGKTPRFDIAALRLGEVLKRDLANADAHLLKAELLRRTNAADKEQIAALEEAIEAAPVPELFHEAVGFHLQRNGRNKAIRVLETAVALLPDHTRLRTRLASLLLRAGRRPEAIDQLQAARDADPLLPDAYGLLGMARREEGAEKIDEAESLLREAVRLAPTDLVQTSRLVWLLLDIARGVPERAEGARAELRGLCEGLIAADGSSSEAHLLYAIALREEGGDLDQAAQQLAKARKLAADERGGKAGGAARLDIEEALLDLHRGKLDEAETRLRRIEKKEPHNPRVFAALAKVLEARGQYVAAFHETRRAAERTAPSSLDRHALDLDLVRLQALVEAGAGAWTTSDLTTPSGPDATAASADAGEASEPIETSKPPRVRKARARKTADDADGAAAPDATPAEAEPTAVAPDAAEAPAAPAEDPTPAAAEGPEAHED
ncbi:MAG: Tetratricopeptide repeat [Pseudomonadota bacterium]